MTGNHHRIPFLQLALAGLLLCSCSSKEVTPVAEDQDPCFVVFGDVQQGYGIYTELANRISELTPGPMAAFCCGDLMLRAANEAEGLSFHHCSEPITEHTAFYLARGNHDGNDAASEELLRELFPFPPDHFYFAVAYGSIEFIVLDTQEKDHENSLSETQVAWLGRILDSASAAPSVSRIFLFMHHPLYPQGYHKGENLENADTLHALFLEHPKIRAVFAGHDHFFNDYVRDGLHYITTGGAGASLFHGAGGDYHHFVKVTCPANSSRVHLTTIGIFNEVIDSIDF